MVRMPVHLCFGTGFEVHIEDSYTIVLYQYLVDVGSDYSRIRTFTYLLSTITLIYRGFETIMRLHEQFCFSI